MGEVVSLKDARKAQSPSDSARDALMGTLLGVPVISTQFSVPEFADFLLVSLWAHGFQIVPVRPPEDAA